jgi:hypothetical protein
MRFWPPRERDSRPVDGKRELSANASADLPDRTGQPLVPLEKIDLGPAYSNSSINVSIFRQSAILSVAGGQLLSFYNNLGEPVIIYLRDGEREAYGKTVLPALVNHLLGNGHCVINLGLSNEGILHVLYGAHETRPFYLKLPLESVIQKGERRIIGLDEWLDITTYPQFYSLGEDLLLLYRCLPGHCIKRYRREGWSSPVRILDGDGTASVYIDRLGLANEKDIIISWVERLYPSEDGNVVNDGIYWAFSGNSGQSWQSTSAKNLKLPLTSSQAGKIEGPWSGIMNQGSGWLTADRTYYLVTQAKSEVGIPNIFLVKLDTQSGTYQMEQVSDNSNAYEYFGHGTLSLPLSRPDIAVSGKWIHVIYRHAHEIIIASRPNSEVRIGRWSYLRTPIPDFEHWEPNYDMDRWINRREITLFVQNARQEEGDKPKQGEDFHAWLYRWREN